MADLTVLEFKHPVAEDIVARLEKLLAAAKSGDIVALVAVYEYREGGANASWDLAAGSRPTNLLGEVLRIGVRLATRITHAADVTGDPIGGPSGDGA